MKNFQKIILCFLILFFTLLTFACSQEKISPGDIKNISPFSSIPDNFEEYEKIVYKESFENGVYIVNGDTPIINKKELKKFHKKLIQIKNNLIKVKDENLSPRKLIIEKFEDGTINRWSDAQKLELTYCISRSTAGRSYSRIVSIFDDATSAWEEIANVNFIHLSEYDDNCNEQTEEVLFNVRMRYGLPYPARSFFPGEPRAVSNILINSGFVYQANLLTGLLKHELGHVLGFRHEHIRPEANSPSDQCMDFGYGDWEALTEYDSDSVMHYVHCGGTTEAWEISHHDIEGAQSIYGAPGEDPVVDPILDPAVDHVVVPVVNPVVDPEKTTETIEYKSQYLNQNNKIYYETIPVIPGTKIQINMTGTGDADIYVKYDVQPDLYSYDKRAYASHSNEEIVMIVPALAKKVYVMVHGYKTSTIDLEITYALK